VLVLVVVVVIGFVSRVAEIRWNVPALNKFDHEDENDDEDDWKGGSHSPGDDLQRLREHLKAYWCGSDRLSVDVYG
jgi:hypothetical protein